MATQENKAGISKSAFEKKIEGKMVSLWTLKNKNGLEMTVTNYGGKVVSLLVPDKNGNLVDVVTGYNNIDDYLKSGEPYFGATIGRYGNRIANGKFTLDGVEYTLAQNNGPNNLHGGSKGFHAVVWNAKQVSDGKIELIYTAADGEEGFPGKLDVKVVFELTDDNEFVIDYYATTDKKTICNLTNHSYYNLSGEGEPTILDHLLQINADTYLPTDAMSIPLEQIETVEGTPMDFTYPKLIGADIEADFEALKLGNGYDHNYIINESSEDDLAFVAQVSSPLTGIEMVVFCDQPGVQLYTGNFMNGTEVGKTGKSYLHRAAFCLETQKFPDSPNRPEYPSVILEPGETYRHTVVHKFGIKE